MDIREYYQETAKACFYVASISLGLTILFFMCHIAQLFPKNMLIFSIPLIIVSVLHFLYFRMYEQRGEKLGDEPFATGELLEAEHILLVFMPAPTLRLLLFDPNGLLLGEIRDQNRRWFMWLLPNIISLLLPKNYELVNTKEEVIAKYALKAGLTNSMTMFDANDCVLGYYQEDRRVSFSTITGMIYTSDLSRWMPICATASLYSFPLQTVDRKKIASFQEGVMPLEWTKRFELNTPILTFSSVIDEGERQMLLGFLAAVLHHHDN